MLRQSIKYLVRSLGIALITLAVAAVVLAMVNGSRFDGMVFSESADGLLHHIRATTQKAAAMGRGTTDFGTSPVNGFCYRFDEHLDDCQPFVQPHTQSESDEPGFGADFRTLGREMRKVVFARTSSILRFRLMLPEEPVTLYFGYGHTGTGGRVELSVSVNGINRSERVFSTRTARSGVWRDPRPVDLSGWANRMVEIAFSAQSSRDNTVFWTSPVLLSSEHRDLNFMIALEEGLRADRLSAYGCDEQITPIKDGWLGSGVLFEDAIAQAATTRASLASLMTSLYPSATGVVADSDVISESYTTLAEVLRQQGFLTAAFVQSENAGVQAGLHQGFDHVFDQATSVSLSKPTLRADSVYDGELSQWLRSHRDRNFFVFLHIVNPLPPYDPVDRSLDVKTDGEQELEPDVTFDPAWVVSPTAEDRIRRYDAEVRENDLAMARLLETLDELDMTDSTLLTFLSDHGQQLGEHGSWGQSNPAYAASATVPLIMVYPNSFPRGTRIEETVQLIDVMPTVLDVANVFVQNLPLHGRSLQPLIWGESREDWEGRIGYSLQPNEDQQAGNPWGSVFFGNWHAISSPQWSRTDSSFPPFFAIHVFDRRSSIERSSHDRGFALDFLLKRRLGEFIEQLNLENRAFHATIVDSQSPDDDVTTVIEQHLAAIAEADTLVN
jgi:arylsulfatase A-like enzyme